MCDTIEAIKTGVYKIKPSKKKKLTKGCQDFLGKCLETDPKVRISIEELSNHKWLDDGLHNSEKKSHMEVIEEEVEIVDKVIEKVKDVSNHPRR